MPRPCVLRGPLRTGRGDGWAEVVAASHSEAATGSHVDQLPVFSLRSLRCLWLIECPNACQPCAFQRTAQRTTTVLPARVAVDAPFDCPRFCSIRTSLYRRLHLGRRIASDAKSLHCRSARTERDLDEHAGCLLPTGADELLEFA